MNEESKRMMFAFSIVVVAIVVVTVCWFLYTSSGHLSVPNTSLAERCEESGGVLVQGVNDTAGTVSEFSICIPEQALYCADIE